MGEWGLRAGTLPDFLLGSEGLVQSMGRERSFGKELAMVADASGSLQPTWEMVSMYASIRISLFSSQTNLSSSSAFSSSLPPHQFILREPAPISRLYARTLDKLTNDLSVLLLIEQLLADDNYNYKKSLHILANADLVLDTALSILHVLWHSRATVAM